MFYSLNIDLCTNLTNRKYKEKNIKLGNVIYSMAGLVFATAKRSAEHSTNRHRVPEQVFHTHTLSGVGVEYLFLGNSIAQRRLRNIFFLIQMLSTLNAV